MSLAGRIVQIINAGIIKFISIVTLANRDYPYHDYISFTSADNGKVYQVGKSNVDLHGSQQKYFVSKSTLLYCTVASTIRFNHSDNVVITIPASLPIEFKSNIRSIYPVAIGVDTTLHVWFEGVLPQEARSSH